MAFISSLVGAVLGAGTFLAGVVTAALKLAVGIGLNLLAQSLAGKQKGPAFSINGELTGGGDVPRSIMMGRYATAGSLVWTNTWGNDGDTKNAYLTQVIALSDVPVKSLAEVWVNGEKVTLGATETNGQVVNEYIKDGKKTLWVRFYDGTQTTADPLLIGRASNGNRAWGSNRIGRGVAYVVVTALVSKNMFSGIPSFNFAVDGMRLYDPSRDTSVGGSGTQRLADPSTWGGDGDNNPAVQLLNILLGIKYNGQWLYGFQGMSPNRLNMANWIQQINKCRAPISSSTGTEQTYRSGLELPVDAAVSDAVDALLTACQGRIAEIGGRFNLYVGAPDAPDVLITDGDIISTEGQSFTPFYGLADSINGISAKYPSPADGWAIKTAPPLYRTDLEAKHGNRRLMSDIELTAVPYDEQVQRLQRSALFEAQRARRHTFTLPPKFWAYAIPGATISWTSVRNGYVNKLFRIDGAIDGENLEVMIDVTEVDPSDYDWNSGTDYVPVIDGDLGPMRPAPQPIIGFGALPDVAKDSNGNNRRCAIRLFWDGTLNAIDFVRYEVRLASDLSFVANGVADEFERGAILIAPGTLLPNEDYQVRACYGTYDGNSTFEWSSWIAVKTLDIRLGPLDIYPIDIEELNKDIIAYQEWTGDSIRYVQEELDRIGAWAADQEFGNFTERQIMRNEISLSFERTRADYSHLIEVAVGPGSAIVTRIENLEVAVEEDIATAVDLLQTQINVVDGKVEANATAITALSATVNNVSADATFRMGVVASPSGWTSRIAMQVRVGTSDSYKNAGIYLDATTTSSRVVIDAEQFVVTDGTNSKQPMLFTSGELTLAVVNVGTAYFDTLQSRNGKLIMRGYGSFADIRMFT